MAALVLDIPAEHPAAAGHFPGNPIIPGAWLLDALLHALAGEQGQADCAWRVRSAKFTRAVRPGDRVSVDVAHGAKGASKCVCRVGADTVLIAEVSA